MHHRALRVNSGHPFLIEEKYFWKTMSEADLIKLCRRFVGVRAPMDTEMFEANLFNMQTQLEQLREFPINAGQLLNATMSARGEFALGVYDR